MLTIMRRQLHPSVKTDVFPSEPAQLTDPECAAVDKRQQGLVVQTARFEKPGNTSLGEYSGKFLRLSDLRKHQSSGLFKSHDLVVVLQPKDRVLKKGDAVPFLKLIFQTFWVIVKER